MRSLPAYPSAVGGSEVHYFVLVSNEKNCLKFCNFDFCGFATVGQSVDAHYDTFLLMQSALPIC